MTSSRSFYVDSLILGKHQRLQQQQQPARRNDDMMLHLSLLHQSLQPALSHPPFAFYPYVAQGRRYSAEVRRVPESLPPALSCLAGGTTALPTCLCSFCLPLRTATGTSSPTHERKQTNTESLLTVRDSEAATKSPSGQRLGWQPWLQQTTAADETQLHQSAPTKPELHIEDLAQHHQLTVTGLYNAAYTVALSTYHS